ncbi:hypothetical protein ACLKA7_014083 [Drosophila subpalustris]
MHSNQEETRRKGDARREEKGNKGAGNGQEEQESRESTGWVGDAYDIPSLQGITTTFLPSLDWLVALGFRLSSGLDYRNGNLGSGWMEFGLRWQRYFDKRTVGQFEVGLLHLANGVPQRKPEMEMELKLKQPQGTQCTVGLMGKIKDYSMKHREMV